MARKERGWFTYLHLRKLTRAWKVWRSKAHEQIARGRIRDTFKFSKAPDDDADDEPPAAPELTKAMSDARGGVGRALAARGRR